MTLGCLARLGLLVALSALAWWVLIAFGYMAAVVLLGWR